MLIALAHAFRIRMCGNTYLSDVAYRLRGRIIQVERLQREVIVASSARHGLPEAS